MKYHFWSDIVLPSDLVKVCYDCICITHSMYAHIGTPFLHGITSYNENRKLIFIFHH